MRSRDGTVTIVQRSESPEDPAYRAAMVAAARAHPGKVIALIGQSTEEVARAIDGPAESATDRPAWRIDFEAVNRRNVALLDRDGTILEDRPYLAEADGVVLLPGALDGLRALSAQGIRTVVLTNQSGVGRGLISPVQLAAVHARLESLLSAAGVELAGIYSCPHTPEAGCLCRKPADGLARRAAKELGFALSESVVVGDKPSDLELGHRLGVPAILVRTGEGRATLASAVVVADYLVDDLAGLARLLVHPAGLPVPAPVLTN